MEAWDRFLPFLEEKIGKGGIETWVRPLKIIRFDAANLYLEAENFIQISWFDEHIRPYLKKNFLNNNGRPIRVHVSLPNLVDVQDPSLFSSQPVFITPDSLDPAYTLKTFIVEQENALTVEIIQEQSFNPIFLVGDSGSGKSHLLQSIAQKALLQGKKAFYVKAETFTEHVVQAIRNGRMRFLREVYRNIDMLIVDDVEKLAKKHATQEEFFHTFNALHTASIPILLSSQKLPSNLTEIEPRLTSRFEWGIILTLKPISLYKRVELKSAQLDINLSQEASEWLVETFQEKAFSCLLALTKRHPAKHLLSLEKAKTLLSHELLEKSSSSLTPDLLMEQIGEKFELSKQDLLGPFQTRKIARARQMAMYACRQRLKLPLQKIGEIFGKDHSTVLSSIRKIEEEMRKPEGKELVYIWESMTK